MEEFWKDIKGYEGLYQISIFGRIKSLKRIVNTWNAYKTLEEKEIKQHITKNGYKMAVLYKNGERKNFLVHRLVAETFLKPIKGKNQVNHKDENKTNNVVDNLEWCSAKENIHYGSCLQRRARTQRDSGVQINNKGTSKKVICNETGFIFPSMNEVERVMGLDSSAVTKVCKNKKSSVKGYTFSYV